MYTWTLPGLSGEGGYRKLGSIQSAWQCWVVVGSRIPALVAHSLSIGSPSSSPSVQFYTAQPNTIMLTLPGSCAQGYRNTCERKGANARTAHTAQHKASTFTAAETHHKKIQHQMFKTPELIDVTGTRIPETGKMTQIIVRAGGPMGKKT